mgnify:CR=1 FL=1
MLSLDSPRWSELEDAYGSAGDIPALLRALEGLPPSEGESEPWFTLWSALAHQGDVYPASFAAVPHVIAALSSGPSRASSTYFQFPAWVEICRVTLGIEVPSDLRSSYFEALSKLPQLVATAASQPWDEDQLLCALAAVAAAKGHTPLAEAVLELSADVIPEFMQWLADR